MRSLAAILCALAFVVFPVSGAHLFASEPNAWRPVSEETGAIRDIDGLEQLAQDFTDSGTVRLRLLQPYIDAGEFEKVMVTLEWLYERGYVFSEIAQQQIPKLLEGMDPGRIAERLRAEANVIEASEVVATVPAEAGLVESVMAARGMGPLAVTSVSENAMFANLGDDNWVRIPSPGKNDLSGIVNDEINDIGWLASANIDGSEDAEAGFSGLIGIAGDPATTIMIAAPTGVNPSDIAISEDGTLYASDPLGGGVYRATIQDEILETLIAPGVFRSPQGLAISSDNTKLYVSDYRYGIAIIDLENRAVSRLRTELPLILDGMDGMWRYKNELIVVQNGTSPMRIAAFELSEDGMSVIGHRILEQAHSEWTEPLSGSIDGDALIYIGNGQWDKFVDGKLGQGKEVDETQIRALPLRQN